LELLKEVLYLALGLVYFAFVLGAALSTHVLLLFFALSYSGEG
jgi:hypothetical protein